jgi:F-type H+-transporting ATPase subunit delta
VRADVAGISESLDEVPELAALLTNPETDPRTKADVLDRVLGDADELSRNVVRLLVEKGRAAEIREVAAEFEALVAAQEGILDVELTTASGLSDEEFGRIVGRIEAASGRKVQATRSVDPGLIGGLVLQAGSMRLDASVRGRLERLRTELASTR